MVSFQTKFKENDISGLTPKKTRYPAPKVSSPLSSHDEILKEYRSLKRSREPEIEETNEMETDDVEVVMGVPLPLSPSVSLSPQVGEGENPKKRVKRSPVSEEENKAISVQKENVKPSVAPSSIKSTSSSSTSTVTKKAPSSSLLRKPSALRNITNVSKS